MHHSGNSSLILGIIHLLVTAVSVLIVGKVMPGIRVKSLGSAIWFALLVAVLNVVVWHVFGLLALPFAIFTMGIGALILNGIIYLVADKFTEGVEISGCFTAVLASLAVSFMNWVFHFFIGHFAP